MTREEASKIIKDGLEDMSLDFADEEQYEALTMAITALEQEPCNTDTCKVVKAYMNEWDKPNNFDAISRQAVMDCFKKWQPYMATRLWDFEQELSKLPSVNPQEPKVDVLDKIIDEVCDIDDEIVLNPDSLFERKAYVRAIKVIDIIDKYKAESEDKE